MTEDGRADDGIDLPLAWFDWLTWPALVLAGLGASAALLATTSPTVGTTVLTVGAVVVLLVLERVRPHRPRPRRHASLWSELGHVAIGAELGSALGYGGAVALAEAVGARAGLGAWPSTWPVAAQVGLGVVMVDVVGYAHHRLLHVVPLLWPLHALHHQPRDLDLIKTGRFHLLDLATVAFASYLPLLALGAPATTVAWVVNVGAIAGLLQHANVRMPTPAWLDALVCTPAAHWRHHSRDRADDGNFATALMVIDRALGTWAPTRGRRPDRLGLEHDPLPAGFWASLVAPLRRSLLR